MPEIHKSMFPPGSLGHALCEQREANARLNPVFRQILATMTTTPPTMNAKTFPLAVVLSATTGRLLCPMDGIYEIMNHVTGDNLFTHVLPRAFRFAAPLIKAQWPQLLMAEQPENLAKLDTLIADGKARNESLMVACQMWLDWMMEPATCGLAKEYSIASHADAWLSRNPVEEAEAMVGKDRVIQINA